MLVFLENTEKLLVLLHEINTPSVLKSLHHLQSVRCYVYVMYVLRPCNHVLGLVVMTYIIIRSYPALCKWCKDFKTEGVVSRCAKCPGSYQFSCKKRTISFFVCCLFNFTIFRFVFELKVLITTHPVFIILKRSLREVAQTQSFVQIHKNNYTANR